MGSDGFVDLLSIQTFCRTERGDAVGYVIVGAVEHFVCFLGVVDFAGGCARISSAL